MDKELFKVAFSVVKASDSLRLEVIQMTENKRKPAGRILPKLLLAAVIVTLLTTTAFATAKILDALKGGETKFEGGAWYALTDTPSGSGPYDCYKLFLDVEINPDAPKKIETYYMPVLDEGYMPALGEDLDQKITQFAWTKGLRNWADSIYVFQEPGGRIAPTRAKASIFVPAGEQPQAQHVTLGEINGYLVENHFDFDHGRRNFYWSDGDYLFTLWVPDEYSDEQLAALAESVRPVSDIEPYLVEEETRLWIAYGDKD